MQPASEASDSPAWRGTSRYEVLRCIGRGGMGVVYEAFDRERGRRIAIKTLLRFSPGALYLFKQEFRTLANVLHQNLVQLHELVASDSDGVFFTMELVPGQDFRTYIQRPEALTASRLPPPTTEGRSAGGVTQRVSGMLPVDKYSGPGLDARAERATTPADLERLRGALRQLAEGVHALHAAGKVHRDIKPSNVLVTEEGRVVLLDFGVATELSRVVDERLLESHMVGTPEYMAPEQALDEPLTAASDWYSVGALLYEGLVGKPPFVGDATDVLYRKALLDPPPPGELVDGVPEDLDTLCCNLLQRAPEDRWNGRKVLRWLGGDQSKHPSPPPANPEESGSRLFGRGAELAALHDAFEATLAGQSVIIRVSGASGMGKTALVQHFLDELVSRRDAVALRGCAYERESVAYKAVDGVVDALSRCLISLERRGDPLPLPADAWALACLFPVLRRVDAIASLSAGVLDNPQLVRQRAFVALRSLLSELARLHPMVLSIDDVQWGDVDSATLLREVMRPPLGPPVLLILGYRDGAESEASPFLETLLDDGLDGPDVRDVPVEPLGLEDARRLALELIGSDDETARRAADAIARGSGGSAYFVEDLARSIHAHGLPPNADAFLVDDGATLDQMIAKRVAQLGESARRVLEIVAIHGRPVAAAILRDSARLTDDLDSLVNDLRGRHFVRAVARDGREMLETTHDRIREAVLGSLSAESARSHHRRLALAYESQKHVDAEALVVHWLEAGESERATVHAERAAEQASEKLAFDRTVYLYRLTLAGLPARSPEALRVQVRLAEALGWNGRGAEAAQVYLEAARAAPAEQRAALEEAGANQLLMCGKIEEGSRILRNGLLRFGRGAPSSATGALFWMIVYSAWLRIIGLRFVERDESECPPRVREHLSALYLAVTGLTLVDTILGVSLLQRFLVLALRTGERPGLTAAACLSAAQLAGRGGHETPREIALVRISEDLASRMPPLERPVQALEVIRAVRHFVRGHWKQAHEICEKAFTTLPVARGSWNAHALAIFGELALGFLGEAGELARRLPHLLADAERRGDMLKIVNLRTGVAPMVFLAQDNPTAARRHVLDSIAQWSQRGFMLQHWRAMIAEVDIDLYDGQGARACERIERDTRAYRRSMLHLAQYVRAITTFARARSAVAASYEAPDLRRRRLRVARLRGRRLAREGVPWISALATFVMAAVAHAEGDLAAARLHLRAAADLADGADMKLHACAARLRLGSLLDGDDRRKLIAEAEEAMMIKGVRAPERYANMILPGRWPASRE